jgi:hypothetical protein
MRAILRSVPAVAAVTGLVLLTGACKSSMTGASSGASTTSQGPTSSTAAATTPPASATATTTGTSAASATSTASNYPVDLQPSTAAPGQTVTVYGLTCTSDTGTATSSAFTQKVSLSMLSNALGGSVSVKPDLASGKYTVTVTCGSITVEGTLTVQ